MQTRAWSTLTLKAVSEELRVLEGVATTPSTDRLGDVVEPTGAQFDLPLPLLWQHDAEQPIGHVTRARATRDGISISAQLTKIAEPGRLRDRLDEAWQSIKSGLVRGLSIGFAPIEYSYIDGGGIHFLKWAWLELSTVTIPANAQASIATIKSLDSHLPELVAADAEGLRLARKALSEPGALLRRAQPTTRSRPVIFLRGDRE